MIRVLLCLISLLTAVNVSKADLVYKLDIFTQRGSYADSPSIELFFDVVPTQSGIDFTFHNESSVSSIVSDIYFESGGLLVYRSVGVQTGTSFTKDSSAGNFPSGNNLIPSFATDVSFGANPPPQRNGISPGESLTIKFDLKPNSTMADVVNALNSNALRIGVHLISLPDGTSESAVSTPLPSSIILFGMGGLLLKRKRKRAAT